MAPPHPLAEVGGTHVAEAFVHVAAVLVAHMPQDDAGVVPEALGQRTGQRRRAFPEHAGGGTVLLARPEPQPHAPRVDRQGLRVIERHPRGRRRRPRRQVHVDPHGVQRVDEVPQPVKVVHALARLQARPREDPQRHQGHPRLAHHGDVRLDGLLPPLLGVPVPAVGDPRMGPRSGGGGLRRRRHGAHRIRRSGRTPPPPAHPTTHRGGHALVDRGGRRGREGRRVRGDPGPRP